MNDIDIGRLKNLLKVASITNLIASGVITHEQALKNSAYRHFLKDELKIDTEEVSRLKSEEVSKPKIIAKKRDGRK